MQVLLVGHSEQDTQKILDALSQVPLKPVETVHVASLGDALQKIDERDFDVALLNLSAADSLGLDAFMRFKKNMNQKAAVVAFVGGVEERLGLELIRRGAEDVFLRDSWDSSHLERVLQFAVEKKRIQNTVAQNSSKDPLTGLLNAQGLSDVIAQQNVWVVRGVDIVAIQLTLNHYGNVRRTIGDVISEAMVKEAANRIRAALRATDYVACLEEGTFVVLLPQTRIAEGLVVVDKLKNVLASQSLVISGTSIRLKASSITVPLLSGTATLEALKRQFHTVLRRSLETAVPVSGNTKQPKDYQLTDILGLLRRRESFRVVKQPIMSARDGTITGYEFLSRFEFKDFESPDDFFFICRENDFLTMVDHYCFMNCVSESEQWFQDPSLGLHFNLFPSTLMEVEPSVLLEELPEVCRSGRSHIEISERQIIGDPCYIVPAVKMLQSHGIKIAMDEVRFGPHSLESIVTIRPQLVKIERHAVTGIAKDSAKRRSLERFVRVMKNLDIEVCAVGVETQGDLDVIQNMDIASAQGFFWGAPE
ncbi:MAG: hypothetical protein A2Y02_01360 [Omnitrophica bacterium GWA2_52_12]|nr:MAG: hypothetical protein A2Y02_01360 [Omnitrophica bacterium GWA2_52_12]